MNNMNQTPQDCINCPTDFTGSIVVKVNDQNVEYHFQDNKLYSVTAQGFDKEKLWDLFVQYYSSCLDTVNSVNRKEVFNVWKRLDNKSPLYSIKSPDSEAVCGDSVEEILIKFLEGQKQNAN